MLILLKKIQWPARLAIYFLICSPFFSPTATAQRKVADSLLKLLPTTRTDTGKIDMLNSIAYSLRLSDTVKAQHYRKQALAMSNRINYDKGKAWALYLEGVLYTYKSQYVKSMASEIKAIELGRKIKDYEIIARAFNTMGLNHLRLEDNYNAMKAFKEAQFALKKSPNNIFEAALLFNIGTLYIKEKKHKEGFANFHRAIEIYLKTGNQTGLSLAYLELGNAYAELKKPVQAVGFGLKSLELARATQYTQTEINALSLLGNVYISTGQLGKAKQALHDAMSLANEHNFAREKLKIYGAYASLYAKEKKYEEAYLNSRVYSQLYDSLFNVGQTKVMMEYQEKFQSEQKDLENKLLKSQKLENENKIRRNTQFLYIACILLGAFIVFSILIFAGYRKIKHKNLLLLDQKEQIEIQKEKLEELNTIKDKLFSVIAHDLRSPFVSMKHMIDLYDEGMISKEDIDYFFKEIRKDIGSSSLLIDNLLIWAKSQLQGFKTKPVDIRMDALANEVLFHFKKQLADKQIAVDNKISTNISAYADYEMTLAVLRNLVGNAIKFTPKKGTIKVGAEKRKGTLLLVVEDSGIGISPENKEKLFQDSFYTTQGLNREKGTGLGLQICKEFLEKNDGKIWAESDPGTGTKLYFTLPESTNNVTASAPPQRAENNELNALKETIQSSIKLQHKYDRYDIISKATNDIIWDWDYTNNEVSWNEALKVNFGYPFEKTSLDWWSELVHPDDIEHVKSSLQKAVLEKQTHWEGEYKFKCADGSYKFVLNRGLLLYDDAGIPFRIIGIMQNIDSQKATNRDIQRLSLVATLVNNLVVITDEGDRILWVNKAFEIFTGYQLLEVIGRVPKEFLAGADTSVSTLEHLEEKMANNIPISAEVLNYTKSGQPYWVQIDCTPFNDPINNQKGHISILTVITERKKAEQVILRQNEILREIARISSHDLRNPISSILGLIKILKDNPHDHEAIECINMINDSAQKLDSLIYAIHNHIDEMEVEEA